MSEDRKREPQKTPSDVANLIKSGVYKVTYDGKGLQDNTANKPAKVSTWYNFDITTTGDVLVGGYHAHPTRRSKRNPTGYASGNLRIKTNNAFGEYICGQAFNGDWDWLLDEVAGQLP